MKTVEDLLDIDFLSASDVEQLIRVGFADSEKRCRHIFEVAKRVRESAEKMNQASNQDSIDVNEAYCAALLHDVGYLDALQDTGFHPIDGARFLSKKGFSRIAELIVCHSNSPEQSQLKGLEQIEVSEDVIAKLITYWDVQILQGGERVSYDERLADVKERYGEEHDAYKAHLLAEPRVRSIIAEFTEVL